MDKFKDHLQTFKEQTRTKVATEENKFSIDILEIPDFNLAVFKQKFKEMCKPYKVVLDKFKWFIASFFGFNIFTVSCILWSLVLNYEGTGCKLSVPYYIHYLGEITYFLGLWLMLAFKLNRNHSLITSYKNGLMDASTMDQCWIDYLNFVIERKSPFAIFGIIIPSNRTFVLLVTSVVFPLFVQIIQSANDYTSA